MARWTDVRVASVDTGRACQAIVDACGITNLRLDFDPPSSGPEVEIQVEDIGCRKVKAALEAADIEVLAIRQRTGSPLSDMFRSKKRS